MYGEGRNWRYLIGFGLLIVLLFVIIFMIVHSGGGSSKVPETKRTLTSYVDDANITVSETVIGPVVASENHNELQISVTNQAANIDVYKGYDGNVVNSQTYPISNAAFGEFLSALEKTGYTLGNTDEKLKDDKGFCPTGQRYVFEIKDGSDTIQRFWATSCNGTKTYKGKLNATLSLFRAQIPNYNDVVTDTNFKSNSFGF